VTGAREEILGRIRTALRDVPSDERPADVPVARDYRRAGELSGEELVARFTERVRDYHAEVRRVPAAEVGKAVDKACAQMGVAGVVVPEALSPEWRPSTVQVIDDRRLTAHELDVIDGAVTGCAVAIAETGTLVLDGQDASGRRLITLIPNHHVCIVRVDQIVGTVPEAVAVLAPAVRDRHVPVTFVSGGSATSDIELSRVEGVHGPRHLVVLIAG
jgi:L-lactate dehydrogenase complex protein LldG